VCVCVWMDRNIIFFLFSFHFNIQTLLIKINLTLNETILQKNPSKNIYYFILIVAPREDCVFRERYSLHAVKRTQHNISFPPRGFKAALMNISLRACHSSWWTFMDSPPDSAPFFLLWSFKWTFSAVLQRVRVDMTSPS